MAPPASRALAQVGGATKSAAEPPGRKAAAPSADALRRARAHFERGQQAYRSSQLKQALEQFQAAYQLAPSAELDFDLAHVYERMGEAGEAIRYYRNYLKHGRVPDSERQHIDKRIQSLIALLARQRVALIERPLPREALAAEAQAFFQRGTKLFRQAKYEAALIAFTEALRFAKLPELKYNLAVTCERLGRKAEAVQYYRAYLSEAVNPKDTEQVEARIRALKGRRAAGAN